MSKPILCLDFDGVIHSYKSGWQGAAIVADPPVDGAMLWIERAVERFRVCILSSRSHQDGGIDAMRGWLHMHLGLELEDYKRAKQVLDQIEWPKEKPPALVTIDDRAITFNGTWPSLDEIAEFKPWNKRAAPPNPRLDLMKEKDVSFIPSTRVERRMLKRENADFPARSDTHRHPASERCGLSERERNHGLI